MHRFYRRIARRPQVLWSRTCPKCRQPDSVCVRSALGKLRFWYCTGQACGWACWRPPVGADCPRCGAALLWAHSRNSVGCDGCGFRLRVAEQESGINAL
jgi:ssDNA-binding Zn-finger/Zn-ribbon topoisomerase 1